MEQCGRGYKWSVWELRFRLSPCIRQEREELLDSLGACGRAVLLPCHSFQSWAGFCSPGAHSKKVGLLLPDLRTFGIPLTKSFISDFLGHVGFPLLPIYLCLYQKAS